MRLNPSSAYRWMACPGSVALTDEYPPRPGDKNESASEGIAFHWVSQQIIEGMCGDDKALISSADLINTLTPEGVLVTDEMYEAALLYTNDIFKYCNQHGLLRSVSVEKKVNLDALLEGMYGYCDAYIINEKEKEVVIWDAKFGHGFVDAFRNWQLIIYAFGISKASHLLGRDITFRLKVVQPRSFTPEGPIRDYVITMQELVDHIGEVVEVIEAIKKGNADCVPASKQCRNCPARHACTTLQQTTYNIMDYLGTSADHSELVGLNLSNELRLVRNAVKLLDDRLSGLETQAIASGNLPGFTMQQGYGRKRWRQDTPVDEVIMMGDLSGVDLRGKPVLTSPTQAVKLGIDEDVINGYSETPMGKIKLVEIDGEKVRHIFKEQ